MKKAVERPGYHDWLQEHRQRLDVLASTPKRHGERRSSPYADYGAEAEFTPLDEEIHDKFDYETGHHKYVDLHAEDIIGKIDPKTGQVHQRGQVPRRREDRRQLRQGARRTSSTRTSRSSGCPPRSRGMARSRLAPHGPLQLRRHGLQALHPASRAARSTDAQQRTRRARRPGRRHRREGEEGLA